MENKETDILNSLWQALEKEVASLIRAAEKKEEEEARGRFWAIKVLCSILLKNKDFNFERMEFLKTQSRNLKSGKIGGFDSLASLARAKGLIGDLIGDLERRTGGKI